MAEGFLNLFTSTSPSDHISKWKERNFRGNITKDELLPFAVLYESRLSKWWMDFETIYRLYAKLLTSLFSKFDNKHGFLLPFPNSVPNCNLIGSSQIYNLLTTSVFFHSWKQPFLLTSAPQHNHSLQDVVVNHVNWRFTRDVPTEMPDLKTCRHTDVCRHSQVTPRCDFATLKAENTDCSVFEQICPNFNRTSVNWRFSRGAQPIPFNVRCNSAALSGKSEESEIEKLKANLFVFAHVLLTLQKLTC